MTVVYSSMIVYDSYIADCVGPIGGGIYISSEGSKIKVF